MGSGLLCPRTLPGAFWRWFDRGRPQPANPRRGHCPPGQGAVFPGWSHRDVTGLPSEGHHAAGSQPETFPHCPSSRDTGSGSISPGWPCCLRGQQVGAGQEAPGPQARPLVFLGALWGAGSSPLDQQGASTQRDLELSWGDNSSLSSGVSSGSKCILFNLNARFLINSGKSKPVLTAQLERLPKVFGALFLSPGIKPVSELTIGLAGQGGLSEPHFPHL